MYSGCRQSLLSWCVRKRSEECYRTQIQFFLYRYSMKQFIYSLGFRICFEPFEMHNKNSGELEISVGRFGLLIQAPFTSTFNFLILVWFRLAIRNYRRLGALP